MLQIKKITAHPTVDFAAEELKKYMRMMMPECGEIFITREAGAKKGLRLGLMQDFGLDVSEAEDVELDDIVHVDVDDAGNGVLAGSNPRSVLFAVYRYLQENGCRWLFPGIDGEYIPMQDVHAVQYHKMADMRYRGQCNEGAEFQRDMMTAIDFTPKIGLNIFMMEFFNPKGYYDCYYDHKHNPAREAESITEQTALQWKRQCEAELSKRGLQFHDMGHGWCADPFGINSAVAWGSADGALPEESRQYMAEIGGVRGLFRDKPLGTNVCMSNPEARRIMANAVADYAEKHQNVDYLHVWLADYRNNHCECAECVKMTPSDWYVTVMNEVDEALTARGLDTRIVLISYVDTTWAPKQMKLRNPRRFTLMSAPISRDYTQPVQYPMPEKIELNEYKRNQNEGFRDVHQYIHHAKEWKKQCDAGMMLYEYHFYLHQYYDPGQMTFARQVYTDIVNYHKHGFQGLINDCSQRSFFPNGFPFYIYGQLQFDTSLSFEELREDYFSHAYGDDWRAVLAYLERIGKAVDPYFVQGKRSADPNVAKRYNPAKGEQMRAVRAINEDFAPFLASHRVMPYRAQTVAYKLLRYYAEYVQGITEPLILKAHGAGAEAKRAYEAFMAEFGRHECEIELWYDQHMCGQAWSFGVFNKPEANLPGGEVQTPADTDDGDITTANE
ncbi:MAG: DUF4838 domain-containing protein [Ruminococcaceae bacterium]|nr:DUF4838 domain-containing protein [Oscillospiraceae bacterium]